MKIRHHIASEHAVYKSGAIFIGLCVIFTLIVSIMSFGRYGYLPSLDFFWAPLALILFWQWKAEVEILDSGEYEYTIKWFGLTLKKVNFTDMDWIDIGKISVLRGKRNEKWSNTIISLEKGNNKQLYLEKMIQLNT